MSTVVIDTNVLLVANGQHGDVSEECVIACTLRLELAQKKEIVVIDDCYRIICEYQKKTNASGGKQAGDVFLKWLQQNKANSLRVHMVQLTEVAENEFSEFPDQGLQSRFDPPDRKFVATANAHPEKPPILQATDSKWLNWWSALLPAGIAVDFICPEDICQFYQSKFPDQPVPKLP